MVNSSETAVPKFGSFKPKKSSSKATNPPDNNTKSNSKERELKLGNHRIEKHKSNRTSSHASQGDSYRPRNEHNLRQYSQDRVDRHRDWSANRGIHARGTQLRGAPLSRQEHEPFFVDTRGDSGNLQYGKSNKWTLSMYNLYGSGSIVGLDPDIKIDRKLSDHSSYTLMYPRNKQPLKVIDILEFDEPFERATADEHGANTARSNTLQSSETDFVPLPFRQDRDDGQ
jgi:hypothetical protein